MPEKRSLCMISMRIALRSSSVKLPESSKEKGCFDSIICPTYSTLKFHNTHDYKATIKQTKGYQCHILSIVIIGSTDSRQSNNSFCSSVHVTAQIEVYYQNSIGTLVTTHCTGLFDRQLCLLLRDVSFV